MTAAERIAELEYALAAATPPECPPVLFDPFLVARIVEALRRAREAARDTDA